MRCGFYEKEITPPLGESVPGYFCPRPAADVWDKLYAKAAVFEGENGIVAVLILDAVQVKSEFCKKVAQRVTEYTGIPADNLVIAATHTHYGVPFGDSFPDDCEFINEPDRLFVKVLERLAADTVILAWKRMEECTLSYSMGWEGHAAFCRDYQMKDGTVRTNPGMNNPNIECVLGEPDEQLQLVRFVRKGKKEIAIVNFQCHPDTIGGYKFSADWPGLACTYLERAMDGEVDAIFINGAQGDTNHLRTKKNPGEVIPDRYEMAKHMGRAVAGSALSVWGLCAPAKAGRVQAAVRQVKAVANKGRPEEIPQAEHYVDLHLSDRESKIPGKGMERVANIAAAYRILQLKDSPAEVDVPVSVVSIGNTLAFGGFPGEPFTWIGTEIKKRSPFAMTIPACCVNGQRGYFPVRSAYTDGGYENATSRFAAGIAERLAEGALEQFREFYGKGE